MAIENTVSIDFLSTFLDSIGIFDCRLPGVWSLAVRENAYNACPASGMQNGNDGLTVGFLLLQYSVVYIEDLT